MDKQDKNQPAGEGYDTQNDTEELQRNTRLKKCTGICTRSHITSMLFLVMVVLVLIGMFS